MDTHSLEGETSLRTKKAHRVLHKLYRDTAKLNEHIVKVYFEKPNRHLFSFSGSIHFDK